MLHALTKWFWASSWRCHRSVAIHKTLTKGNTGAQAKPEACWTSQPGGLSCQDPIATRVLQESTIPNWEFRVPKINDKTWQNYTPLKFYVSYHFRIFQGFCWGFQSLTYLQIFSKAKHMVSAHGVKWSWSTLARYQMEEKVLLELYQVGLVASDFDFSYLSIITD